MSSDLIESSAAPPVALTPASGFALGRQLRVLRAAVAQDDQRARAVQSKIAELNATMVHYRAHAAHGMRNNEKRVAGMLLTHASRIESQIADLERQAAEIRNASIAKRKEIKNINAQLQEHRRQAHAAELEEQLIKLSAGLSHCQEYAARAGNQGNVHAAKSFAKGARKVAARIEDTNRKISELRASSAEKRKVIDGAS